MFGCQLNEAFNSVFGKNFSGIISMTFSRGSVRVNNVIRLSSPASQHDLDNLTVGVTNTFARNGFEIDDFSVKRIKGCSLLSASFILQISNLIKTGLYQGC